jgi:phosphoglycolate phosphatase
MWTDCRNPQKETTKERLHNPAGGIRLRIICHGKGWHYKRNCRGNQDNKTCRRKQMKYRAVIFDMDGTVLNTLDDLIEALNYSLEKCGHLHEFDADMVKIFFGSGIRVAIQRALAVEYGSAMESLEAIGTKDEILPPKVTKEETDRIEKIFDEYYPQHSAILTGAYPGIPELIRRIKAAGIRTAVVSNKIDEAVQILSEKYFSGLFEFAIGESPKRRRKPFPDMTAYALEQMGIDRTDAVYVGDSEIDMQTAENSGLDCISVSWGFRGRKFLESHKAKQIADRPEEILKILGI